MDLGLADRVVLVTGASGGIGRAMAEEFAAEGALLALHGHGRVGELKSYVSGTRWRSQALVVGGDLTRRPACDAMFRKALAKWGRVDVCIANAGHYPAETLRIHEVDERRIRATLEANLTASIFTARAFLASLAKTGPRVGGEGASLLFVGSTAGRFGERGHFDYAAAKAGLAGLVATLKNEITEIDPYARVNMVEPGWTVTRNVRPALEKPGVVAKVVQTMALRQLGRARDVAKAAAFLSSHVAARHVSGQTLVLAGGMEGRVLWPLDAIDEDEIRRRFREE